TLSLSLSTLVVSLLLCAAESPASTAVPSRRRCLLLVGVVEYVDTPVSRFSSSRPCAIPPPTVALNGRRRYSITQLVFDVVGVDPIRLLLLIVAPIVVSSLLQSL
ncbi:hypothetical protein SOVF_171180, partial [Spinacia oleracea]